jgi:hypothetical protein
MRVRGRRKGWAAAARRRRRYTAEAPTRAVPDRVGFSRCAPRFWPHSRRPPTDPSHPRSPRPRAAAAVWARVPGSVPRPRFTNSQNNANPKNRVSVAATVQPLRAPSGLRAPHPAPRTSRLGSDSRVTPLISARPAFGRPLGSGARCPPARRARQAGARATLAACPGARGPPAAQWQLKRSQLCELPWAPAAREQPARWCACAARPRRAWEDAGRGRRLPCPAPAGSPAPWSAPASGPRHGIATPRQRQCGTSRAQSHPAPPAALRDASAPRRRQSAPAAACAL